MKSISIAVLIKQLFCKRRNQFAMVIYNFTLFIEEVNGIVNGSFCVFRVSFVSAKY